MKKFIFILLGLSLIISCSKKDQANVSTPKILTDTVKQNSGSVITYNKPDTELIRLKRDTTVYSEEYLQRLRKLAEYYIANSQRSLVMFHASKPESHLGFSVEENDWEGINYTQIGIFNKTGANVSTLQWLFYEPKSQTIYEFDLNKKKFTPFILK